MPMRRVGATALLTMAVLAGGCDLLPPEADSDPTPTPTASERPAVATSPPAPSPSLIPTSAPVASAPPVGSDLAIGGYAEVLVNGLRVRAAPGTASGVRGSVDAGEVVQIVGGPADADSLRWWEISIGELRGYAASAGADGTVYLAPTSAP
jgi:hypothetical protein